MNEFTEYVCGFMIDHTASRVALVLKSKPEWQRGRWNGVGGKIEPDETPHQAMAREFREEAGVETVAGNWLHRVTLNFAKGRVFFFVARSYQHVEFPARLMNDEPVEWKNIRDLPCLATIPNIRWLVPLCMDDDLAFPIVISDVCDSETNGATVREKRAAS